MIVIQIMGVNSTGQERSLAELETVDDPAILLLLRKDFAATMRFAERRAKNATDPYRIDLIRVYGTSPSYRLEAKHHVQRVAALVMKYVKDVPVLAIDPPQMNRSITFL